MQNKFVLNDSTKDVLRNKTLLLDTNVLIDAYRLPSEFFELLQELASLDCDIVTTKTLVIEFLGGTTDTDALNKKISFLEMLLGKEIVGTENFYLPVDRHLPSPSDFLAFNRTTNKFAYADFEIYLTLKKYKHHLLLITRNHKDSSTKLVKRVSFITLLGASEIHTYSVCSA